MPNTYVNINTDNNIVSVESSNESIRIINNDSGATVNIVKADRDVVRVNGIGPQGPQGAIGAQGASGSIASLNTASFATTGSNTFIGTQIFTGSIEINNTNIQYYNPQSVLFLPPVYTLVATASVTHNLHVTQSGPYFIDCRNIPNNTSCSVNLYVYPDLMPSGFVANVNAYAPISTGSNSSVYMNYKTIVSASNSTSYYQHSTSPMGAVSQTLSRFSFIPRPVWIPVGDTFNAGWFFKTPANQVMLLTKPGQLQGSPTIQSLSLIEFTGSNGTPLP